MNADKMFKELGYERMEDIYSLKYRKIIRDNEIEYYREISEIEFIKSTKEIDTSISEVLTINLLKAINKQCKELGWLDEEEKH